VIKSPTRVMEALVIVTLSSFKSDRSVGNGRLAVINDDADVGVAVGKPGGRDPVVDEGGNRRDGLRNAVAEGPPWPASDGHRAFRAELDAVGVTDGSGIGPVLPGSETCCWV